MLKESISLYNRRLIPYIRPHWRKILLAMLCMIPVSLCDAAIAYLVKPGLDKIFFEKNLLMLKLIPIAILSIYAIKGAFGYAQSYLMGYVGHGIVTEIRDKLYFHIQRLSLSFFQKNPTGVLMSRILNDVNLLQLSVGEIVNAIKNFFRIIGLCGVLFYQDWKLASIAMFFLPWSLLPMGKFGKKSRKFSTKGQKKMADIATFLHETITGCRIVKAFGMEEYENERFLKENLKLLKIRLKRLKIRALSPPIMELIGATAGSAVMFYGGYNVIKGYSTPGTFFSFVAALILMYDPIKNLNKAYQTIQEGLAAVIRVFEIMDIVPEIRDKKGAIDLPPIKRSIRFENVWFSYDGERPVLKNINLDVKVGEIIAIAGVTGSGKSTLVNLIPRFYDVTSGRICIDGHDIRDVTLRSLRSQIALVTQQTILFNDTVRNNISYGNKNKTEEEIIKAAIAADAHEFISSLPEGYDTVIGEQGVKLSGGQKQRIAIARAILKDAPILILDEATSSLDSKSEQEVQSSLEKLMNNRTTFVIAHRLSTIKNADRIIVLSEGKIVEEGKHEELLEKRGLYYNLYMAQYQQEKTPSEEILQVSIDSAS